MSQGVAVNSWSYIVCAKVVRLSEGPTDVTISTGATREPKMCKVLYCHNEHGDKCYEYNLSDKDKTTLSGLVFVAERLRGRAHRERGTSGRVDVPPEG